MLRTDVRGWTGLGYVPRATMATWAFDIRAHERAMTWSAGLTMACLGAAAATIASAADALFLAHVGPTRFGIALALSSVLLVVVLTWVGNRADRAAGGGRGTLLQNACTLAALVAIGLSLIVGFDATVGAWLALLCGKQLTSSVDLLFWVLAAKRLDARQNRRLVPIFVTAHGLGTVAGAFAVGPLAHALGSQATLLAGGLLFAGAALGCRTFARHRGAHALALSAGRRATNQESAVQIVRTSRMTRHLALVVAIAGVFAPLLYVLMGTAAQAEFADDTALTAFFGQYRGAVQLLTFVAQLLIAPRILARAGVAFTLLMAPSGAFAGALALGVAQPLALVVATQALVKLLDAALQTPAEKLAQNLLPRQVRGRVAGFLDGVAKRAGAIAGGAGASLLISAHSAMAIALIAVAALWLAVSVRMYRHFADMAVAELERSRHDHERATSARTTGVDSAGQFTDIDLLADRQTIARLRADLIEPQRQELAIELLLQIADRAATDTGHPLDIRTELAAAAARSKQPASLLRALIEQLLQPPARPVAWPWLIDCLLRCLDASEPAASEAPDATRLQAARALGLAAAQAPDMRAERRERVADALRAAQTHARNAGHDLALRVAETRAHRGDTRALLDVALDEGSDRERDVAFGELTDELAIGLVADLAREPVRGLSGRRANKPREPIDDAEAQRVESLLAHTWVLLRTLRRRVRQRPDASCARAGLTVERVVARCEGCASSGAEVLLLRAQTYELARSWLTPETPAPLLLAGARLLAHMARPEDAGLLAQALGHSDPGVRSAAAAGLARLGPAALDVLLATSRYARRSARSAAAAVLRELRVSTEALKAAIESELMTIDRSTSHLAAFTSLKRTPLLAQRLVERIQEATRALFTMLAARVDNPSIDLIGAHFSNADPRPRIGHTLAASGSVHQATRAQALETLDTVLPRELATRVTAVLEDGPLAARAQRARQRLSQPPASDPEETLERAIQAELALGDPLTSALVVHALDSEERAHHRQAIFAAANDVARSADPIAMLQRLTADVDGDGENGARKPEENDMPRLVETLMLLHRVPLFAELTTRQLAELAEVVSWRSVRTDEVVVEQGQAGDAMYFVVSGQMRVTVTRKRLHRAETATAEGEPDGRPGMESIGVLGPGEPFGEMSLFEELPRSATVSAAEKSRIGRISRTDFESLVEEMPSIALAICRVLSRRVRIHNAANTPTDLIDP